MKQITAAGIIIVDQLEHPRSYLLIRHIAGHWGFPKGKLEAGEDEHTAAKRELYEETGLTATIIEDFKENISYLQTGSDGILRRKVVHFYLGVPVGDKTVRLSHEHDEFVWFTIERALKRLSYDEMRNVLTLVDAFLNDR